jgi:hypothetical protein
MAITRNIVVGISDIHNEPDAILFRSTENNEDINIQVVTAKFAVKYEDVIRAVQIVKEFVDKREPIEMTKQISSSFTYGEEN